MTDNVSRTVRSRIMSKIKSTGSKIEKAVAATLIPLSFVAHPLDIFGSPDFVHHRRKIAVFIDGCFWHGCPEHFKLPKTNTKFWANKIRRNITRDQLVSTVLKTEGWRVIRIWEHDIRVDGTRNKPRSRKTG